MRKTSNEWKGFNITETCIKIRLLIKQYLMLMYKMEIKTK